MNKSRTTLLDRWRLVEQAIADATLSMPARLVLTALCTFHNDRTGRCDPSTEALGGAAGIPRRQTVMAAVRELEVAGYLVIRRRFAGKRPLSNAYVLNIIAVHDNFDSAPRAPSNPFHGAADGAPGAHKPTNHVFASGEDCGGGGSARGAARRPEGSAAAARSQGSGDGEHDSDLAAFWAAFPNSGNEAEGTAAWRELVAAGIEPATLLRAASAYSADWDANRDRRDFGPRQAATWLKGGHWKQWAQPRPEKRQSKNGSFLEEVARRARAAGGRK